MANYIEFDIKNPLNLVDQNRVLEDIYNFKHFDEWKASEQVLPWEYWNGYKQKWQTNDIIFLQAKSNYDPIYVSLVNLEDETQPVNEIMDVVTTINDVYYLQTQIALDGLPEGCYKVIVSDNLEGGIRLESEELHIADRHPGTMLYKYWHNTNKGILYETGIYQLLRVESVLSLYTPVGNRVVYIDTPFNSKTVKGYSARMFSLFVGGSLGIPDWIIDKLQNIFDLNNVYLDGKKFTAANEGAKFAASREDQYRPAGWIMEVAEAVNRGSKRFENTGLQDDLVAIDYSAEGKLFGAIAGSSNDNTYTINEIE